MFVTKVRRSIDLLREALAEADPSALEGAEAVEAVELFCEVKRYGEAGISVFGPRVQETGAFSDGGHRSASEWLGNLAGESTGRAKGRLDVGTQLSAVPQLDAAVRSGEVSGEQARVIAGAAVLNPAATPELLEAASNESFTDLMHRAASVRQAALSDEEHETRRLRVHRQRNCRSWPEPTGGVNTHLFCTDETWGRCSPVLEDETERLFREARANGVHESRDAYRADAMVSLLCRGGAASGAADGKPGGGPGAMVQLRVDVESLRRGRTAGDEVCEIEGVGPVPVAAARRLLGDCVFELLVKDGCDLVNLTGHARNVPTRLRTAVLRRDRRCRWPRCNGDVGLEVHHWRLDCHLGEVATLSTLVTLCGRHHDLCTYGGWRIEPHPDEAAAWRPVPPVAPVNLDEMERWRRLVKKKAQARRDAARAPARSRDGPGRASA